MLKVEGLRKGFGSGKSRRNVLAGVDFEVAAGEAASILGSNGSGKSTLLRCIAGLVEPDAGTVALERTRHLAGSRLAFVFDGPRSLLPRLTVRENIDYFGAILGVSGKCFRAEALRVAANLGLPNANLQLQSLSRGTQQKVMIAIAIASRSDLVVCDEPTSFLDVDAVGALGAELSAAMAAGAHVVISTHDVRLTRLLKARTYSLSDGLLKPADDEDFAGAARYVAQFLQLCDSEQFSQAIGAGDADCDSLSVELLAEDMPKLMPYLKSARVIQVVSK